MCLKIFFLNHKCGLDGNGSHSQYQHNDDSSHDDLHPEKRIPLTAISPLKLSDRSGGHVMWKKSLCKLRQGL